MAEIILYDIERLKEMLRKIERDGFDCIGETLLMEKLSGARVDCSCVSFPNVVDADCEIHQHAKIFDF